MTRAFSRLASRAHRACPAGMARERFDGFFKMARGTRGAAEAIVANWNTYPSDTRMPASLIGLGASQIAGVTLPISQLVGAWSEPAYATIGLGGQAQRRAEAARGRPLGGVEVHVARAQGEAVRLTDDRGDPDLDAEVEVPRQALDHRHLLGVLLPEVGAVGRDRGEELRHDRGDALEVPGPRAALELRRHGPDLHSRGGSRRVHRLGRRLVDGVDLGRGKHRDVALGVARVAGEILARAELDRVHEDAHDHDVVLGARQLDQAQVPRVERAHRRHEPDRAALSAPPARGVAHRAGVVERPYGVPTPSAWGDPYLTSSFSFVAGADPLAEYSCSGPGNLPVRTSSE